MATQPGSHPGDQPKMAGPRGRSWGVWMRLAAEESPRSSDQAELGARAELLGGRGQGWGTRSSQRLSGVCCSGKPGSPGLVCWDFVGWVSYVAQGPLVCWDASHER